MLLAYFDESGTHERSPITAIGGFVASKDAWKQFELELATVLSPYAAKGVRWFHMTDALAQAGQYAFLEKPFINAILWGIGHALHRAQVTTIYSGVVQDDWDAIVSSGPFKDRFPKPYHLCFEDVLYQLYRWSKTYGDGEPVAPTFAIQDEYYSQARVAANIIDRSGKYARWVQPATFDRPERLPSLQAADFAAHSIRGNIEKREYWESVWDMGPTEVFERATAGKYAHGGWYDASALRLAVNRFAETGDIA